MFDIYIHIYIYTYVWVDIKESIPPLIRQALLLEAKRLTHHFAFADLLIR